MNIKITKLQESDFEKLFVFERENRAYFEEMVPSRGDGYYNFETFIKRNKALLDEQAEGLSFFYLIIDETGQILGRMNLVDIDKKECLGHLGYRVGEKHTGKGIAHTALNLLLINMDQEGIKQVVAKTTTNNIASQRVLEKSGFVYVTTGDEAFEMNGVSVKFVYYKWINEDIVL